MTIIHRTLLYICVAYMNTPYLLQFSHLSSGYHVVLTVRMSQIWAFHSSGSLAITDLGALAAVTTVQNSVALSVLVPQIWALHRSYVVWLTNPGISVLTVWVSPI